MAVVRIEDCRKLGYCKDGVLGFLARYGLPKRKLVKEGLPEKILLDLDNALATKIVEYARLREGG